MVVLAHPAQAQSKAEKDAAVLKYKGKFLIAKKDGVSMGLLSEGLVCSDPALHGPANIVNDVADIQLINPFHCDTEPIHKGEVLKITAVRLLDVRKARRGVEKGVYLSLGVENVSPHAVTRGVGAFAHQSMERGRADIIYSVDFTAADALAAQWFTLLDGNNPADAAQLGNTASGIFVNQVKAGMSFAEVESALGVPLTRVDLGEKVLYKYKDMTVEFHGGKVTDVR
jgi:hypothetical protein